MYFSTKLQKNLFMSQKGCTFAAHLEALAVFLRYL